MNLKEDCHPLFGSKQEKLPDYRFPKKIEVINHVRYNLDSKKSQNKDDKNEMLKTIATKVITIWKEAYVQVSFTTKLIR